MLKKYIVAAMILMLTFVSTSCNKKTSSSGVSLDSEIHVTEEGEKVDISALIKKLSGATVSPPREDIKKATYSIDAAYKKEKLSFESIDYPTFTSEKLAVAGKKKVKMYKDINAKQVVAEIPLGTVIPLLKTITNNNKKDMECSDVFVLNEERNYWYETEYKEKKGFVFGSYLVLGDDYDDFESSYTAVAVVNDELNVKHKDSNVEKFTKMGYYYTKPVKSESFVDFNGRINISKSSQSALLKNRIALEKVNFNEYQRFLSSFYFPDDMIALYGMMHNDRTAATFITADLLVHSLHLLFDKMLQDTEANRLMPILKVVTKAYYDSLSNLERGDQETGKTYRATIGQMKKFFLVAGHLLNMNLMPLSSYPGDVAEEIKMITSASGMSQSPVFKYEEDYSQFKPRGHYTKNEKLKRYFRAMMWFGRLHFYCVSKHPDQKIINKSISLTRSSLLLTKIAKENSDILTAWRALSIPIGYLIGESDDYTLEQFISISDEVDFESFGKWIENKKNILAFISKANKTLKPPAISGNTLMQNPTFHKNSPVTPAGFRFLGQRFTIDSFVHQMLSSPRLANRYMVKGLDVMGALNSQPADRLLKEEKKKYPGYEDRYNQVKTVISGYDDYSWQKTFFNSYLKIVKETASFDSTMPFYFTNNKAWDTKTLLTAHASWAELRHDTILYVKQNAAEKAGPGPCKTFNVEKLKRPTGYIEPNLGALYWMQYILKAATEVLANNGFMSEAYSNKFKAFSELIDKAVAIAEYEAADKKIDESQNEYIYSIPNRLAHIVNPLNGGVVTQDELKMSLIADVHTDAEHGEVLEVGTGMPYRIHVALNDGHGGKRIATGYIFSYYEFSQPMSNRLNDEEWKKMVYPDSKSIKQYTPDWAKDILPEN